MDCSPWWGRRTLELMTRVKYLVLRLGWCLRSLLIPPQERPWQGAAEVKEKRAQSEGGVRGLGGQAVESVNKDPIRAGESGGARGAKISEE